MQFVIEGILIGLFLASLLGPIFIALTQTAVEKGARAGITVGLGIWVSDLVIISLCYWFIQLIKQTIENESFMFWMGMAGGCVLIVFGAASFFKRVQLNQEKVQHSFKNYAEYWLKGFVVNTVNPFTFVFWIGAISTYIIGRQCSSKEAMIFLGTIFITIVVTDSIKVILSKLIRRKLTEKHLSWFSKIAGLGLFVFGIILIVRSL